MPGDNDLTADDGQPAYEASLTTLAKLRLLSDYLAGFCTAAQSGGPWYGLDLFAGSGVNRTQGGVEVPGSTLRLLEATGNGDDENPAARVIAVEKNAGRFAALRERTVKYAGRVHLRNGSFDVELKAALELIPREAVSFAVIDPEGFEVPWATIAELAGHRRHPRGWKMEQLILFPSSSICRVHEPRFHPMLNRVFGSNAWRSVYDQRYAKTQLVQVDLFGGETIVDIQASQEVTAEEAAMAWADLYADRLKSDLGYTYAQAIPMGNERGRLKYHLIFASDNEAGDRIMKWVGDRVHAEAPSQDADATLMQLF